MNQNLQPQFVDRRRLLATLRLMTRYKRSGCLLTIEAAENMGKSFLLSQMKAWCDKWGTPCALVDLANGKDEGLNYKTVFEKIRFDTDYDAFPDVVTALDWQPSLPNLKNPPPDFQSSQHESQPLQRNEAPGSHNITTGHISGTGLAIGDNARAYVNLINNIQLGEEIENSRMERVTRALVETFKALTYEQVWVLLFDSYERRLPQVETWLDKQLLPRIAQGKVPRLLIIVAGRERLPELSAKEPMSVTHHKLDKFDLPIVKTYLMKRQVDLARVEPAFISSLRGIPGRLSIIVDGYLEEAKLASG
jgi:hypothetical protein